MPRRPIISRRRILQAGAGAAALGALGPIGLDALVGRARAATGRAPGSLPFPNLPAGTATGNLPFDHIVIVMQENHSFDNYLGMLPICGQPLADGFTFDQYDQPTNYNMLDGERMYVYQQSGAIGASDSGSQSWDDTHAQIAGGAMSGFAATGPGSMGYYTEDDLPFYYSLAKTFTLANRWFCSAPAQTYPNRRFLMAGTASGIISTNIDNVTVYPAAGTIWDQLSTYGVSWTNYFSDAPTTVIIEPTVTRHPTNYAPIAQFYADAAAGTLPAVSLVDCYTGVADSQAAGVVDGYAYSIPEYGSVPGRVLDTTCETEENPEDVQLGEAFVARVVDAVFNSPAWQRTLLIWMYDEHGGYYDHVPPAATVAPDSIPPMLQPGDAPGDYTITGCRVPAVVVSPYAMRNAVTNVVHDHTSVLATIEAQWNLPALTYRDANAATVADFLDTSTMAFAEPPTLATPADPTPLLVQGYQGQPAPPSPSQTTPSSSPIG